ncbi:MAG: SMI1/KNR4 family protein [Planctomycetes bacterium]|nr:SMI1/KNR4 family protein [Planctomycetota bacterium]
MTIGDDILKQWRRDHVIAAPGASDEEVLAFERVHGVRLPDDFRHYLQLANGTSGQMDGDMFCFRSLHEVKPVFEELGHHQPDSQLFEGCFVFADYSISAWLYAIQLIGDDAEVGRVFLVPVNGTRGTPLARTFTEFGRLYLEAPQRLHPS